MESIARDCPKLRHLDYAAVDEERGEHVRLLPCRRWGVNGVGGGMINGNGLVANEESIGFGDDDNDAGGGGGGGGGGGEGKVDIIPSTTTKASVSFSSFFCMSTENRGRWICF
jgi:hypothetical protein